MRKDFEIGELVVRMFDVPDRTTQDHTGVGIITRICYEPLILQINGGPPVYEITFFRPDEHKRYLKGTFLKRAK